MKADRGFRGVLDLQSIFIEKRGYDPQEKLPYLVFDGEGAEKIRHDYWKTVAQRSKKAI